MTRFDYNNTEPKEGTMATQQTDLMETASARLLAGDRIDDVAADLGLDLIDADDGERMLAEPGYYCDDGSCTVRLDRESTATAAAEAYVAGGDYRTDPESPSTTRVLVRAWREGVRVRHVECAYCPARATAHDADGDPACSQHAETPGPDATLAPLDAQIAECRTESESIAVTVDPDEPPCRARHRHDWQSPHAIVGGVPGNPGVRGHGGGVIILEVCVECGCARVTDTWATDCTNGQEGVVSVTYRPGEFRDEVDAMRDSIR